MQSTEFDGNVWWELFDELQHGDKEHREWLRDKIIEFVNKNGYSLFELRQDHFIINDVQNH